MRVLLILSLLCVSNAFVRITTTTKKTPTNHWREQSTSSMNTGDRDQGESSSSRRELLSRVGSLSIIGIIAQRDLAYAAAPITVAETENVGAITKRVLRSKPPKVLRKKLNIDFAVLLMQSSYNALDQLDCVAMDQFQRDFFILVSCRYRYRVLEYLVLRMNTSLTYCDLRIFVSLYSIRGKPSMSHIQRLLGQE
jgi:hypothetical protein